MIGALTLARALRSTTPAALRASLPDDGAELVAAARERFERELSPHFLLEERELLPLSDCGDAALCGHAEQIRDDHAALREAFGQLTADQLAAQRDALADRLEAHVRFEERTWFPALEQRSKPRRSRCSQGASYWSHNLRSSASSARATRPGSRSSTAGTLNT